MYFQHIYDKSLAQGSYFIGCQKAGVAAVIDPKRDVDTYLQIAKEQKMTITHILETHIHADFLSGIREFLNRTNVKAYLSDLGKSEGWDYSWVTKDDNVEFVKDGSKIKFGEITLDVVSTPGHTPDHIVFMVTEGAAPLPLGVVSGDFVFAGDLGRPDLLERAAKQDGKMKEGAEALFKTVQKFKNQPDSLMVWPVHCEIGTWGHNVAQPLHTAYRAWELEQARPVRIVLKGMNPRTESYSALQAEVPDPSDPATQLNTQLGAELDGFDEILVGGEASSHCVAATLRHLADHCHGDARPDCPIIDNFAQGAGQVPERRAPRFQAGINS